MSSLRGREPGEWFIDAIMALVLGAVALYFVFKHVVGL